MQINRKSHPFHILFWCLICISVTAQQTITSNLVFKGTNRSYRLRLPANHDKNIAIPLVFNLHGFSSNASQQEFYSNMNAVADTARFGVCYPEGISSAWNVGWAFGSTADDVGFIKALIDDLIIKYGFNPSRIYSCGMSNGGFMSYKLACELNDKIAAIASVTGSMVPSSLTTCVPGKPVPVLEIHGTADGTVDYNGSPGISTSIQNVLNFWQKNNDCDKDPIITMVPNINVADNTTSEIWSYVNCKNDKEVLHYKVMNGAHTWPGAIIDIGNTSRDFSASEVIWKFFNKYSLPISTETNENTITNLQIFPNPFTDQFIIQEATIGSQYALYDMNGSMVLKGSIANENQIIQTSDILSGIYFVKIKSNQETKSFKLVKI